MQSTLGQRLQAAREARGLSLTDAAHETRVPVARLRHLEADNLAAFGSMTYARSFLRLYAGYLGVDAGEALEELPSAVFAGPQDYRYLVDSYGPWVRERGQPAERLSDPVVPGVRRIRSPLPAALAVFICVLAATAMFGKYVADSQRTLAEQQESQASQELPVGQVTALSTATQGLVLKAENVPAAIPVDPLTLVPKQRAGLARQPDGRP